MKGFRKGKVPMALLKKQFGPRLMGEAMQEAVDGAMQGHFDETGDRPAMQPEVKMVNEDWKEGDDVVVEMSYEKLPEIPEIDYKGIKLERMTVAPQTPISTRRWRTSPKACRTSTPRRAARRPMATRS
jgi:trigger factor